MSTDGKLSVVGMPDRLPFANSSAQLREALYTAAFGREPLWAQTMAKALDAIEMGLRCQRRWPMILPYGSSILTGRGPFGTGKWKRLATVMRNFSRMSKCSARRYGERRLYLVARTTPRFAKRGLLSQI